MQKTIILVLSILVLFMFIADASAKIIDVVHLKNGSIIQGTVTMINESIKIETDDGNIFIFERSKVGKIIKDVKLKNRTVATLIASVGPLFPVPPLPIFQGYGQLYNGQYLKAAGFFLYGIAGVSIFYKNTVVSSNEMLGGIGVVMFCSGYVSSIVDANLSAKKINRKRVHQSQKKDISRSLNLNYIPHQGMMASYNYRF